METFDQVDPRSPEAVAAVTAYVAELDRRFVGGFKPGAALVADGDTLGPPHGFFVVVRDDEGDVVACGGVQRLDDGAAEIKRMWVHPSRRGTGLGGRLLAHLEDEAARRGHLLVRLDTNDSLTEAIAMYGRKGYVAVPAYNDNPYARHWFEKSLTPR